MVTYLVTLKYFNVPRIVLEVRVRNAARILFSFECREAAGRLSALVRSKVTWLLYICYYGQFLEVYIMNSSKFINTFTA